MRWLLAISLLLLLACTAHGQQGDTLPQGTEVVTAPAGLMLIYAHPEPEPEVLYELEYGPVGGPYEIEQTTETYYLQEGLEPGTAYEARFRKIEGDEVGEWSEWVQVETLEE